VAAGAGANSGRGGQNPGGKRLSGGTPSLFRAQLGQLLRARNRIADHDPLTGYLAKAGKETALISQSPSSGYDCPMADIFTRAERPQVMSRIPGRGNKGTEVALAKLLRTHRITGWRRHYPLSGTPDFVFRKEGLPFSLTAVSGTAARNTERIPKITGNSGQRSSPGIRRAISALHRDNIPFCRGNGQDALCFWLLNLEHLQGYLFSRSKVPHPLLRAGTLLPTKIARESKKACLKKR
jgi:DNA mismatch endonuclease Vsr